LLTGMLITSTSTIMACTRQSVFESFRGGKRHTSVLELRLASQPPVTGSSWSCRV
jgi:hypothetical protein